MVASRVLGTAGLVLLAAACSDDRHGSSTPAPQPPEQAEHTRAPPAPPARVPELPQTGERDADGDGLDDVWQERLRAAVGDPALLSERVRCELILTQPVRQAQLDDFRAAGGRVDYVFRELRYGFVGTVALERLPELARHFADDLHLLAAPSVVVPFLDEATRTGRVRGIWQSGFAGSVSGYSGGSSITVAVVDSGVYEAHPDLGGRKQGWADYTSDNLGSPVDASGHGTHVASIAVGSGAAFAASAPTLKYTQSGSLGGVPTDSFLVSPIHTPAYFGGAVALNVSASAQFLGGGQARLRTLSANDGGSGWGEFSTVVGGPTLSLLDKNGGSTAARYAGGLFQNAGETVTSFAVANTVSNYPAVADGFNTLRGVAPSSKWFGAKVFTNAGTGNSFDIELALDDLVTRKVTDNIKVTNMSLGVLGSGTDTVLRAVVNGMVDAGIVVVVAAGNDFPQEIGDPGRAARVITVGASNDLNQLTDYTSVGDPDAPGSSEDSKPDLLAPGGSAYRSQILAADAGDADSAGIGDLVDDDYTNMQGTSMATPFVSGSVALMIDALQKSGTSWSFASSDQPLLLKMLLLASASEVNAAREEGAGSNPTLGRGGALRDRFEGYGIVNPDAAIEAMLQTFVSPLNGSVSNVAPARLEWERRAWGRKLSLVNGATVLLNLSVPATGDYDLYLFSGSPSSKGTPVLRVSSTTAGVGTDETVSFVSSATETAYVFVKRVSGHGAFSLTGSAVSHCGDGDVDPGESCDPAQLGTDECCTSTCSFVDDGSSCDDSNACTQTDTCQAGSCSGGSPKVCPAIDSCHVAGACAPATGLCSTPQKMDGASCNDGNACTQTDECEAGKCTGSNPVVCAALDQCHSAGTCAPATGMCSNPNKANGSDCDDGSLCTQTDECQAGKCTGGNPVVCAALDQCHDVGACVPGTGVCTNPAKANGASCNDGDACTQTDACEGGSCKGENPVVCAASDQCHEAGSCNSATGACTNPVKPDGESCDDGTLCTQTDTCQAGACTGANPVVCVPSGLCHEAGVCQPGTGICTDPASADGTACGVSGVCESGTCAESPVGEGGAGGVAGNGDAGAAGASEPTTAGQGAGGEPAETPGAAGAPDSGGMASANGGSAAQNGGSAGAASALAGAGAVSPQVSSTNTSSGCGCSVPGSERGLGGAAWLLGLLVSLSACRRARTGSRRLRSSQL